MLSGFILKPTAKEASGNTWAYCKTWNLHNIGLIACEIEFMVASPRILKECLEGSDLAKSPWRTMPRGTVTIEPQRKHMTANYQQHTMSTMVKYPSIIQS